MLKSILGLTALFFTLNVSGQNNYYKMPNGKIVDLTTYEKVKANLAKNGKVEEVIISKIIRNDSTIVTPRLNVLTQKDSNGNFVDPYAEQKKLIGFHFPIALFKNEKGIHYSKDLLKGKPTLINFWFTTCVPCVEEMPILNNLKKNLAHEVNFFAITYEDQQRVKKFLTQTNLDFHHITNAKTTINKLKIVAYPTNFILDKKGKVVDVYGDIAASEKQILNTLKELIP